MTTPRPILKRPCDFFTNPQQLDIDVEAIRKASEAESEESRFRELEAWSVLNDKIVGEEE